METCIEVKGLKKYFDTPSGPLHAVDDVSFRIETGTTMGVVGESGCGKSTLGRTIIHLHESTGGKIFLDGKDITRARGGELKTLREKMQIIFQDPAGSLDPRMRINRSVAEAYTINKIGSGSRERLKMASEILQKVGIESDMMSRYPWELSGGQQQRVAIARALSTNPEFLVCDEPVSALDVSYQSQVINLLEDLQRELGLTYLFIAHDLSVVRHISTRIGVMYLGKIMELAPSVELTETPLHPYTKSLLAAVPIPDPVRSHRRSYEPLPGEPPSAMNPPKGCLFHTRCRYAMERCQTEAPEYREISPEHFCACHLVQE